MLVDWNKLDQLIQNGCSLSLRPDNTMGTVNVSAIIKNSYGATTSLYLKEDAAEYGTYKAEIVVNEAVREAEKLGWLK
jgi:hypothetical protein